MKKVIFIGAFIAMTGIGQSVIAQPPAGGAGGGRGAPATFADYDKNSDGKISKEEFIAYMQARQAARQAGGAPGGGAGGPGGAPNPEAMFGRWDSNNDGSVTQAEFDARPRGGPGGPGGAQAPKQ